MTTFFKKTPRQIDIYNTRGYALNEPELYNIDFHTVEWQTEKLWLKVSGPQNMSVLRVPVRNSSQIK